MNGFGSFSHHEGKIFDGTFKNNYFYDGGDVAISPLMSLKDIDEYIHSQNMYKNKRNDRHKEEKRLVAILNKKNFFLDMLNRSWGNQMVPFVLSTMERYTNIKELTESLSEDFKTIHQFDMREASKYPNPASKSLSRKSPPLTDFHLQSKTNLAQIMAEGGLYIINIDDSQSPYQSIGYPYPKEIYNSSYFPSQLMSLSELAIPEVFSQVTDGTPYEGLEKLSPDMRVMIWTKFKLPERTDTEALRFKVEREFKLILPMKELDIALYILPRPGQEEAEREAELAAEALAKAEAERLAQEEASNTKKTDSKKTKKK